MDTIYKLKNKYLGYAQKFGYTPYKYYHRIGNQTKYLPKIFCVSIPKSGTHLLQQVLISYPPIYRYFSRVLNNSNCNSLDIFKQHMKGVKNGQFVLSHLFFKQEYYEYLIDNGFKIIFLYRDPRDILLSEAHFAIKRKDHRLNKILIDKPLNERIKTLILGNEHWGGIGKKMDAHYGWLLADEVLSIKFEELVGNLGGSKDSIQKESVVKILEHINIKFDDKEINRICSKIYSKKALTFRKGKINEWEEVYDFELKKLFKEVAGTQLIKFQYEEDMAW